VRCRQYAYNASRVPCARVAVSIGSMNTADLIRRLENLIRFGTIAEVDTAAARCRVKTGGITTAWLPWFAERAGQDSTWEAPSIGEQCVVFCPSGEPAVGVVMVGLYSEQFPAPDNSAARRRRKYRDGAVIDYDTGTKTLTATLPAGGKIIATAPGGFDLTGDVTIQGDVAITGKVDATADVTAGGVSVMGHKHGGVSRGNAQTDAPQ